MLMLQDNNGVVAPASDDEVLRDARSIVEARLNAKGQEFTPETAKALLPGLVAGKTSESFYLIHLDTRLRIIAFEEVFKGTLDETPAYSREVLRAVIEHNSYAVAVVHNHPSSMRANPSENDRKLSQRLAMLLDLIDVNLVDHFVVGGNEVYSMAEHHNKEVDPADILRLIRKFGIDDLLSKRG